MRLFKKAKSTTVTMTVDPNGSKGNHTPINPDLKKSIMDGAAALANMTDEEIEIDSHFSAVTDEIEIAIEDETEDKGSALTDDEANGITREAIEDYLSGLEGDEITLEELEGLMKEIKATYGIVID